MDRAKVLEQWENRKTSYANQWKVGLCSAPCADCPCCCLSLFCPYCASYSLRQRALYGDMNRYECCGGMIPCSGKCGERNCPQFCLCLEVCCCFGTSVAVTRWLLQDDLRIQNSRCDNCILATMLFLQQLACICRIAACLTGDDTLESLADIITFIADVVWWSVCSCVQTQHKIQMDERDLQGGGSAGGYPPPMQAPYPQAAPTYPPGPPGGYSPQYAAGPPGYPAAPGYPTAPGYPAGGGYGYQQQGGAPPGHPQGGYSPTQPPMYGNQGMY